MPEIIHVTPVMPVDEHHIEYALDSAGYDGPLVTSWVPTPMEAAMMRLVPALRGRMRRDPVRLRHRQLVRHLWPDLRRGFDMFTGAGGTDLLAHDDFFHRVDRSAAALITQQTRLVIGREFGCHLSFKRAEEVGAARIYHLPTVHFATLKGILQTEQQLFGDACTATFDPNEFHADRVRIRQQEIDLADRIVCPSDFVKRSLMNAGVAEDKICLMPFGCETTWLDAPRAWVSKTFLFVGNISVRKGAHRLLRAWKELQAHHTHRLLLVGDMHLSANFLKDYAGLYEHLPRLPREDLRDIYLHAQAMVLPALAEGFALVILEALSCGTPVLASRNSGAEGFLTDGLDGKLFETQNDEALRTALEWALSQPTELEKLGVRGRDKARSWPWRAFEKQFMTAIEPVLNTSAVDGSYLKR